MHTAMRIDFARPHVGGSDARFLALALASGIAGLTITYPTITLGNGTVGEWAARFEVRSVRLAAAETLPEMSITARFHDTAAMAMRSVTATATSFTETFASARQPMTGTSSRVKVRQPSPSGQSGVGPVAVAQLVPTWAGGTHEEALAGTTLSPPSVPVTEGVDPVAPLDAVRIVLPPAASELGAPGAMSPQATLNSSSPPAKSAETQSLAPSSAPQARPISASATDSQPLGLFSGAKEVQEFDLAQLGGPKSISGDLARSVGNAIAAAKPARRIGDLPKALKVPDRVVGDYILHVAGLSLDGMASGNLTVRIGMGGDLSIKLADLLVPVQDQIAPEAFQRLTNSHAASEYVSFAQLRGAGFDIRYDPGSDRLTVSAQL